MADVFVSYRRADKSRVAPLVRLLEAAGYSVWWDAYLEVSSQPYPRQVAEALRDAKAVLVLWSPKAIASDWVLSEATSARENGKLVQAAITACAPPPPFNVLELADLTKSDVEQWKRVLRGIASFVNRPPRQGWLDVLGRRKGGSRGIWGASLTTLAIAGVMGVTYLGGLSRPNTASSEAAETTVTVPPDREPKRELSVDSVYADAVPNKSAARGVADKIGGDNLIPAGCGDDSLRPTLERLARASGRAKVRICVAGECEARPVRLGEQIQFEVSSDVSGAIIVLDVDDKGEETPLLPNAFPGGAPHIERGEVRHIGGGGFNLDAAEVETGCVVVIVSPAGSSYGAAMTSPEVVSRGFKVSAGTGKGLSDIIRDAASVNPELPGWAFGALAYAIVE